MLTEPCCIEKKDIYNNRGSFGVCVADESVACACGTGGGYGGRGGPGGHSGGGGRSDGGGPPPREEDWTCLSCGANVSEKSASKSGWNPQR